MKSHTGGKPRHPFTPHIKIIQVPNSKTVFAICKWCKLKHGKVYAIENTQCVNKKDRLRSHFQNCINFKAAITKSEYENLMQITKPKKKKASKSAVSNNLPSASKSDLQGNIYF
ncbi:hypothetical protein F8M41_009652 [Gigaspora margarita]|uniref:Uncharacterized protein n=1 Tax=Gigaspora margarita TaxID=4874 RepID=A0A8H3X4Z8_GIGMA|nr:hypothetical protein F8M41_009652 [Gigaspora margarita]